MPLQGFDNFAPTRRFDRELLRSEGCSAELLLGFINELAAAKGLSASGLIAAADVERSFGYLVLSGARLPGRNTLLRFALALNCNVMQAQKLLRLGAKNELYPPIKRDTALLFCLIKGYSVSRCQHFLARQGLATLDDVKAARL